MIKLKTLSKIISATAIACIASSCASNTTQTRIQKNPALFANLPANQKQLAQQGRMQKGMTKDAVFFAWGKPDGVTSGNRNNKDFERWVYTRSTPVYSNGIYSRVGFGYGSYGRHGWGGPFYGLGVNPGVNYVQRTAATVTFDHRGLVSEWSANR